MYVDHYGHAGQLGLLKVGELAVEGPAIRHMDVEDVGSVAGGELLDESGLSQDVLAQLLEERALAHGLKVVHLHAVEGAAAEPGAVDGGHASRDIQSRSDHADAETVPHSICPGKSSS